MEESNFKKRALIGLSHQESFWADTTGIVRGNCKEGIRYACTECEIMTELSYEDIQKHSGMTKEEISKTVKDPITDKGWVSAGEIYVREGFLKEAKKVGCEHFAKRLGYVTQKTHDIIGLLTLSKLAQQK